MFKKILLAAAFVAGVSFSAQPVHAASPNFSVAAVPAKNQIDSKLHYFDLLVEPNSQQDLTILIQNTASGSQRFNVATNRGTTNGNGIIDYSTHNRPAAQSLKVDIESLLPKPKTYTVAPHSTRTIHLKLTAPKTAWSGMLVGAIRITQLQSANGEAGIASPAQVAYNIGLNLQATKNLPKQTPQLQFNGVKVVARAGGESVLARLENPASQIQRDLSVKATFYHGKKVVMTRQLTGIKMAPTGEMAFPASTAAKQLKAGRYRLDVAAANGETHWHFSKMFTVSQAVIKSATQKPATAKKQTFAWWLLPIFAVIIAALVFAIWRLRRKTN